VELRARAQRLTAALLAAAALVALAPAAANAGSDLRRPEADSKPPRGFRLSADEAVRIAERAQKVRDERDQLALQPTAYTKGPGRWQVSYFNRDREVVQVQIDDRTGAILEQWRGPQVAWTMARGYEGAFGRKLNAPYVWIPLCVLFLAPFVDPRRPFRILHLDLLVLLSFSISHVFFNEGEIGVSVPLVYPALLYLLARLVWIGFRGGERRERLVPFARTSWLVVGLVFLCAFRIGLNVVDSNVIDVGYAGVIGADRIVDGDPLYGKGFSDDVEHGDTYGPFTYLAYVPFEQAIRWSGAWDDLPAAHGAAIAFDLVAILGLLLLGMRLRPGPAGRRLGAALAFAWAAFPYSAFALETNSNDMLPGALLVWALVALTLDPPRRWAGAAASGAMVALAAAAKFAPLAVASAFATASPSGHRWLRALVFAAAAALVLAATVLPFIPDGGVRELFDRTLGYQAARPSPFSIWGQVDGIEWLQTTTKVFAAALAVGVAFVPRRRTPVQVAALAGAVLIALQLTVEHWFYLYLAWVGPLALIALIARYRDPAPDEPVEAARPPALARA
jgi:hypothetical protein